MKRIYIILFLAISLPAISNAQLGGIINKVKSKAKQRADQKVDQQIDKSLDELEGKKTTPPPSSSTGSNQENKEAPAKQGIKSYSRYDFIPGDSVLYYDNFEGEALSELPTGWNTNGSGEVATFDQHPGNWLRMHKQFLYLSSNQSSFGENYTIEFDVILQLKNTGWMFPEVYMGLFAAEDESPTDNQFLKDNKKNAAIIATIMPGDRGLSKTRINSYIKHGQYFSSQNKEYSPLDQYYGRPFHVAIQIQKERLRMWINEEKLFDAPKAVPLGHIMNQIFFQVSSANYAEEQYGVFVSNVKVATGKPDTRHRLIEEGKFSTTGILFDFQSAVIKPESFAVVKEIATVLKENPAVRIKVLGHTSSDGDDNANMELSKKRAASVKELLAGEFGIDPSRIDTEGKGETLPIADNKTREGKAQNRRVEFVKL